MPLRPSPHAFRRQVLAFVLAGLLALAVVALSGWGGDAETSVAKPDARPVPVPVPQITP